MAARDHFDKSAMTLNLQPGIHENVSAKAYHDDPCERPSLNSSIAKILCTRSPLHAYHAHPRLGGAKKDDDDEKQEKVSKEKLLGLVLHRLLLNAGPEIIVCPFDNWMKGDAKRMKAEALAAGNIPTLPHIMDEAKIAAKEARRQLDEMGLGHVFRDGKREITLVWKEGEFYQRAMLDEFHHDPSINKASIWDLKTVSRSSHPDACAAQIVNMGYDFSRVFYKQGLSKLIPELSGRVDFNWAFLEVNPPYAVTPCFIDAEWEMAALQHYCNAVDAWQKCMTNNRWPGYTDKILRLEAAPWMIAAAIGSQIAGNDA